MIVLTYSVLQIFTSVLTYAKDLACRLSHSITILRSVLLVMLQGLEYGLYPQTGVQHLMSGYGEIIIPKY